ncbi:unnamed protein product [Victoria cruziana]
MGVRFLLQRENLFSLLSRPTGFQAAYPRRLKSIWTDFSGAVETTKGPTPALVSRRAMCGSKDEGEAGVQPLEKLIDHP